MKTQKGLHICLLSVHGLIRGNDLELGKDAEIIIYPDTKHAFANPSGMAYNAVAAEDSWLKATAFLFEHLQE